MKRSELWALATHASLHYLDERQMICRQLKLMILVSERWIRSLQEEVLRRGVVGTSAKH